MLVVDFNVANVSTNHHKIPRERNCHWSMLSTRCKISVSDTTLAAWIRCWAWPCIWIQMVDQRTFLSRILHFLQWIYKVQAEFHCLVKLEDVLTKYPGSVTQWVTDNADHTICTLDGKNKFHGMGVIAVSTPFKAATTYFLEFTNPAQQSHESGNRHSEPGYSYQVVRRIVRNRSIHWKF